MDTMTSRIIDLVGADQPVRAAKRLRAEPLTLDLDGDVFRHVTVKGEEAIRAIAFFQDLRGAETSSPVLEKVKVGQGAKGFLVSFDTVFGRDGGALRCGVEVRGLSDGTLVFQVVSKIDSDLDACEMGFVVAYPSHKFAVRTEALDGSMKSDIFQEIASPDDPFRGMRALTCELVSGVDVTCRMTGGSFDVEDLRNDGIPCFLARPSEAPGFKAGDVFEQSVTVSVSGRPER